MQMLKGFVASIAGLALGLLVIEPSLASMPPPQDFAGSSGGLGKSKASLVIDAYKSSRNPNGAATKTGSEYNTQMYCRVVLDVAASVGTQGVLSIRGLPTPLGADIASPEIDEIQPITLDVKGSNLLKTVIVPLRHDATFFEWNPSKSSSGSMQVWATAIPCGLENGVFGLPVP